MAKYWTMACLSAALFVGSVSFAGDEDQPQKPKGECEGQVSAETFAASEKFRLELWSKISARQKDLADSEDKLLRVLEATLEGRAMRKREFSVSGTLGSLFNLGGDQIAAPPLVSDKTKHALEQLYDQKNYENLPQGTYRSDVYQKLRVTAGQAVENDPYFKWMKLRSADNRSEHNRYTGLFTFGENGPEAEEQKPDAVSYFWQYLDISGPSKLTWQTALVRVYRDLDPELTPEQIKLCDAILHVHGADVILYLEFREQFETRNNSWASKEAWDYATDLKSARQAYRRILDEQLKKYGKIYSREGWELAKQHFHEQGEPVTLLRRILNDRENPGDKDAFLELKKKLTLPAEMDAKQVFDIIVYSGNDKVSYEQLLMRKFGGADGQLADRTLTGLRKIIEVAEALKSDDAFAQFLARQKMGASFLQY